MPTYEYRCPNGHEFEKFFRSISSATAENPCPTCGVDALRLMSAGAGLMFKGSGFYLTDYGKNAHATKGTPPKPSGETSGGGDASSSGEAKSGGDSTSRGETAAERKGAAEASPAKLSPKGHGGGAPGGGGGTGPSSAKKPKSE